MLDHKGEVHDRQDRDHRERVIEVDSILFDRQVELVTLIKQSIDLVDFARLLKDRFDALEFVEHRPLLQDDVDDHFIVCGRDDDIDNTYDSEHLDLGAHGFLQDFEHPLRLRHIFEISLFVESMGALNISDQSLVAVENLIWSAHFVNVSILLIVTVVDPLDDTLDLRSLDEIEQIMLNGGPQCISALVILLEHNLSKESFIID